MVDDEDAELKGFAVTSTSIGGYVAAGYRHDGGGGGEEGIVQRARFVPEIAEAGEYEIRMSYTENPNRASKVPVTIFHKEGESVIEVNQRKKPPLEGGWISLGSFVLEMGKGGAVEISNAGADGYVIIDAVQFLKK